MPTSEAIKSALRELKEALTIESSLRPLALFSLVATALLSGVFFAVQDYGNVNIFVSFVAGCVTGPAFLIVGYGSIFVGAFFASSTLQVFRKNRKREFEPGAGSILLLMIYMSLILALGYWLLQKLPIVGHQVGYLLRDQY